MGNDPPSAQPDGTEPELEDLRVRLTREAATILELNEAEQIDALSAAIRLAHDQYQTAILCRIVPIAQGAKEATRHAHGTVSQG